MAMQLSKCFEYETSLAQLLGCKSISSLESNQIKRVTLEDLDKQTHKLPNYAPHEQRKPWDSFNPWLLGHIHAMWLMDTMLLRRQLDGCDWVA